ncbi:MAG TPA: response regulator [Pyrinomonadaceae bacterium]|nr:response regulator [Pyrinomonadaceae bacterium]
MTKLRIIIADDERPAREFLKAVLAGFADVEVIGEAADGSGALEAIRSRKPDIALLDLQMPELSGIEVVRSLGRDELPLIAFVTAYDEHAVKAFELNAVDYLLKPIEKDRLRETLDRAIARLGRPDWRESESEKIESTVRTYDDRPSGPLERIPVRHRDDIILVPVGDVASVTADGELLNIFTRANQKYVINYRLKDLESRLDEKQFVRLSRSAIVNLDMVDRISPMPGGTFLVSLKNGQEIASSRQQSRSLRDRFFKL